MKLLWMCILSHLSLHAYAQQSDSIFHDAKEAAYHQRYDESKILLQGLLDSNPSNADYIKMKANVFAWNKEYDSAIEIIKTVPAFSSDLEALQFYSTFLYWNHQYETALLQVEQIIDADTSRIEPKLLELDILFAMKKYQQCYKKARLLTSNEKATRIARNCKEYIYDKNIMIGYQAQLQGASIIHLTSVAYSQTINKYSIAITANEIVKQNNSGANYQLEVYKKWGKAGYTYASATASNSILFPLYSVAAVHFLPTIKRVETDWGIRFYKSNNGYQSLVPSGGISYSLDRLNVNYRYYKIIGSRSNGASHSFSVCKYFKQTAHSIRFDIGTGNQFDRSFNVNNEFMVSRTGYSLGISYNRPINSHLRIRLNLIQQQQYINKSIKTQMWLGSLSFTYKFATTK